MNKKRFYICTLGGLIAGILCVTGGTLSGNIPKLTLLITLPILFNRIILGLVIGVSSLKIHFLLHGVLMGLLISLISSLSILQESLTGFIMFTFSGLVFGALIELFATKVFKCPIPS